VATVQLENVSKRYPGSRELAVQSVNLTIADGEFLVLLGPSGCGKSTALRMIAGLESITSGTLRIDDQVMNTVPARDRDIAMVFQSYALYPHMTVAGNLGFGLRRRRVAKEEIASRVSKVAELLGLTRYLRRKPHALSGGQRQRVALGRAIVRDPKVFLFDEPLSNLDAALRVSTRNELVKLHQRLAATIIYVTHDQVEAMTMGQRICIINNGKVVPVGEPLQVYREPANTFVAKFLGNPPMNLFNARLEASGDGVAARFGKFVLPLPIMDASKLNDYLNRTVVIGIRPMFDGPTIAGPAVTVQTVPDDNLAPYLAMDVLQAGDVLVIANGGWTGSSVVGDLIVGMFKNIGVAGIVTDGAVRDVAGLRQVGVPVYARGLTANSPQKNGPGSVGLEVSIGGTVVRSGDLIVGDQDGVVVLPQEKITPALEGLRAVREKERKIETLIAEGLTQPDWVKEFLAGDQVNFID
jgi:multiple sugar transport system ATP-binding protein